MKTSPAVASPALDIPTTSPLKIDHCASLPPSEISEPSSIVATVLSCVVCPSFTAAGLVVTASDCTS